MLRLLILTCLAGAPLAAQGALPFTDGKWELRGDSTVLSTVDGRAAVRMYTGGATRRDVRLEDGTIDMDVFMSSRRSFVYVGFRMQDDQNGEEFYIRPHKSGLPDAVQYAPIFQGQSAWQLYHGTAGTAAANVPVNAWTRLRIVLSGRQAAVFLGDTLRPVLVVPRLARTPRAGHLELKGFLPRDTPGAGAIATFANVRVRPGVIAYGFRPVADRPLSSGVIRDWTVSTAFNTRSIAPIAIDPTWLRQPQVAAVEPSGMLELHRWLPMPAPDTGVFDVATVARVRLIAERAGLRRLDLGFSDAATVFLNGQPIFHGNDSYSFPQRRDGLMGFDQATVYLPLRAGANDLSVFVTDHFGGWGLMARLPDMQGLRVQRATP